MPAWGSAAADYPADTRIELTVSPDGAFLAQWILPRANELTCPKPEELRPDTTRGASQRHGIGPDQGLRHSCNRPQRRSSAVRRTRTGASRPRACFRATFCSMIDTWTGNAQPAANSRNQAARLSGHHGASRLTSTSSRPSDWTRLRAPCRPGWRFVHCACACLARVRAYARWATRAPFTFTTTERDPERPAAAGTVSRVSDLCAWATFRARPVVRPVRLCSRVTCRRA